MKRKEIDWSGVDWTQTNNRIGKALSVDHTTVARARKKLGIPDVKRISTANRTPSVLANAEHMFGTMTDRAIADATGVCHQRVTAYRAKLNVAAHQRSAVRGVEDLLGTIPDTEIARMVGCVSETVRHHRKKAGITRCTAPRKSIVDPVAHLAGTMIDSEVAKVIGCSAQAISRYRLRHGISKYVPARDPKQPYVPASPRLSAVREWALNLGRPFTADEVGASGCFDEKTRATGRRHIFAKWVRKGEFVVVGRDPARPGTRANLYALAEAKR